MDESGYTQKLWKKIGLIDSSMERNSSASSSKKRQKFPSIQLRLEQIEPDDRQPKIIIFNEDKKVLSSQFHHQKARFDKNDSKQFIKAIEQLDIEINEVEEFDQVLKDPQRIGDLQSDGTHLQIQKNKNCSQFQGISIKSALQIKLKKILLIVQEFKNTISVICLEMQNERMKFKEIVQSQRKSMIQILEKLSNQMEEKVFLRQKLQFMEKSIEQQARLKQQNRVLEEENKALRQQMTKSLNYIENIKSKNQNQIKFQNVFQKQKLHKKHRQYQAETRPTSYNSKFQQKWLTQQKNQSRFDQNSIAISPQTQKIIDRVKIHRKLGSDSFQKINFHAKTLLNHSKQRVVTQHSPSKFYHTVTRQSNINKMKLIQDRVNRLKTQIQTSISALKT